MGRPREGRDGVAMSYSPNALGEALAQIVWANFSDYLESGEAEETDVIAEELLIFFLWVHTRACQQALGVTSDALKPTLDAMHRTVFEDLEAHGTPRDKLPLIEQRISARYSDYYAAADGEESTVGEVAARIVGGCDEADPRLSVALARAAIAAAGPLRDFLEDVELSA